MISYAFRYGFILCAAVFTFALLAPTGAASDPFARGKYLVGPAGQCADCHGATLMGQPMDPGPPGVPWAKRSANLRGLPMFATDAAAIAYFETASVPSGKPARGPMPHYHFNRADAIAIVAYLRSLAKP